MVWLGRRFNRIAAIDYETHMGTLIGDKKTSSEHSDYITMGAFAEKGKHGVVYTEFEDIRRETLEYLNDPNTLVLMHNAGFDYKWAKAKFGDGPDWRPKAFIVDTMVMERLLTAGKGTRSDLKSIAKRRLGIDMDKSMRSVIANRISNDWEEGELLYAALDAEVLPAIWEQQEAEIRQYGMENAAIIENRIAIIAAEASLQGIDFNAQRYREILQESRERAKELESELIFALDPLCYQDLWSDTYVSKINLNSDKQMLRALREVGIDLKAFNYYAKRDWWLAHKDNPDFQVQCDIMRHLIDYTFWNKNTTWRYTTYINPVTKRIHAGINTFGADTSRMSMKSPNLQQATTPKPDFSDRFGYADGMMGLSYRECFVAEPGLLADSDDSDYVLVTADFSQIEYVVLAELSGEKWMIDAFNNKMDFHKLRASQALKIKNIDHVSKRERQLGKTINFGLGFKGTYRVLQRLAKENGVIIPTPEAKDIVARITHMQPNVNRWADEMFEFIKQKGYIQTRVGHRRWIPPNKATPTRAANTPVQKTAAGILKDAGIEVNDKLGNDGRILLFVHDEIVTRVKREHAEEIANDIIVPSMIRSAKKYIYSVEPKVSVSWGAAWEKA